MKTIFVGICLALCSFILDAQKVEITGMVYDNSNGPLTGVSVICHSNNTGTITDLNGQFKIVCPNDTCKLEFAFIGYNTKVVTLNGQMNLKVKMEGEMALNECVVIGRSSGIRIRGISTITQSFRQITKSNKSKNIPLCGVMQGVQVSQTEPNDESYSEISENGFQTVSNKPLSTFSIDVDKASYSNVRRYLNNGEVPPVDAVRIEEMINYFDYAYKQPTSEHPFEINTEVASCPWDATHKLLMIGVQGKKIDTRELPPSNLVFLIDVSGSMDYPTKLPLLQQAFLQLVDNLRENDRVAIVVYAGSVGCVLPSTKGTNKIKIKEAINGLQAAGSTAGGEGIKLAYRIAKENFLKNGNNRVILATDGDFNVGASSDKEMEDLITEERKSGVFLTCLGFGMGNLKDSKLETLADKGNGNYAYIDNMQEATKTLVSEFGGTMFTIAKDVKIQVEFNPQNVQNYRLLGYENRLLNDEDFNNDTKDAGELGAGHTVTALYEIVPIGGKFNNSKSIDPLKYQQVKGEPVTEFSGELATVKMRFKKPNEDESIPLNKVVSDSTLNIDQASENLRFASAVAMFGMVLRNSVFKGTSNLKSVISLAKSAKSNDEEGYKAEFVRLVNSSLSLPLAIQKNNE